MSERHPCPRLAAVPAFCLVETIPRPFFHARRAGLMIRPQTLDCGLYAFSHPQSGACNSSRLSAGA